MAGRIAYYGGIVTNGLVLDLDAAKKDSYPGTGTAWNDISGNRNNGTLTNGPTFNSSNGGAIVFDGVDDFATSNLNYTTLNNITFSVWYKWNGVNQLKILTYLGDSSANGFGFLLNDGTNTGTVGNRVGILYGGILFNALSSSALLTTTWTYLVVTRTTTTVTLYSNGTFIASTTTNPLTTSTYNFRVYGQNISPGAAGDVSAITFYNRALTQAEITQNYNALKGRYGL